MADQIASGALSVAWDGATPAVAPANSTVVLSVGDSASAGLEIEGTGTWTIVLETTISGATWFAPNCLNVDKTSATASLTAAGRRLIQITGYTVLRARMSARSSGSPVVTLAGAVAGV